MMVKVMHIDSLRIQQAAADVILQAEFPAGIELMLRVVEHAGALSALCSPTQAINDNAAQKITNEQCQTLADLIIYYSTTRGYEVSTLMAHLQDEFGVLSLKDLACDQYINAVTSVLRWR